MAGENKKSVLQSAVPKMNQQGQQDSYNGKNGLMYKYNVAFANGDSGEASAKSTTKVFPVGKECAYVKYTREYNGTIYQSFTSIADVNAAPYQGGGGSKGGGGYKKSPETQKMIINQVALIGYNSCANILIDTDDNGNDVKANSIKAYTAFKEWMYNKIFNLKEDPQTLQGVFKIACVNVTTKTKKFTTEDVIKQAEGLLNIVKNTSWNNPAAAPQQSNSQPTESQPVQQTPFQPQAPPVEVPPENQAPPKPAFEI